MSPTCPGGSRASPQVLAPLVAARMGSIACGFNLPMLVDLSTYCLYTIYIYIHTVQAYLYIYILYIFIHVYTVYVYIVYSIFFNDDLTQNSHRCGRPSFPPMRASGGGCPLI